MKTESAHKQAVAYKNEIKGPASTILSVLRKLLKVCSCRKCTFSLLGVKKGGFLNTFPLESLLIKMHKSGFL